MVLPPEVQRKVSGIENLATIPSIAAEILESIQKSNSTMREIARIIEKDASITAKIIRVSNSPLWGFPGKIDNVQRSLVLLGLKQVTNIVIAVNLFSSFTKLKPNPFFDREKFWLHSAGNGQIARTLAKKLMLNFHGEEFVSALIQDIGKLVLYQAFGEKFKNITLFAKETGRTILDVEKEVLGCSHADIGGWLLERWNFPDTISTAVAFHHCPDKAPDHKVLTSVIYISDVLCEMWGVGFDGDIKKFCLHDDPAWKILKLYHPNVLNVDIEKFTFELKSEIEKAMLFIQLIGD